MKTFGVADPLKEALKPFGKKVVLAFIFGSVATGDDSSQSDIDLFIVAAGIQYADVMKRMLFVEKTVGRPVNPSLYSPEEFVAKIKSENHFVTRVVNRPKIMIVGTEHDLAKRLRVSVTTP